MYSAAPRRVSSPRLQARRVAGSTPPLSLPALKKKRIQQILPDGKGVIAAVDDVFISGPEGGLQNFGSKLDDIVSGGPNAVLAMLWTIERYKNKLLGVPKITNVTVSTTRHDHTNKVIYGTPAGTIRNSVALNASAASVHLNMSSMYESKMLENLGLIVEEARKVGMPVVGHLYMRGEKPGAEVGGYSDVWAGSDENYFDLRDSDPEKFAAMVRHCVAVGVHGGIDILKVQWPGSIRLMRSVVEAADDTPVLIASGPELPFLEYLERVHACVLVGGAGTACGRNGFNRPDAGPVFKVLKGIVNEEMTPQQALRAYRPNSVALEAQMALSRPSSPFRTI